MKATSVSVAEMKKRFSEYVSRSAYSGDRVVITKRNRPVAALVGMEDFRELEQLRKRRGLAALVGKWKGFEEIEEDVARAVRTRDEGGPGRDVSF